MSLARKLNKSLISSQIDIPFSSEKWFKDSYPDNAINITGYQLVRRNRHDGIKKLFHISVIESDNHEVLWVILSPRRLPRGYSNIITAVIYHPPDGNSRVYPFFPITY